MATAKKTFTGAKDDMAFAAGTDQAVAFVQEQFEKAAEAFFKGFDEIQGHSRDNLSAVMKANAAAVKGLEEIGRAWFDLTQGVLDQSVSTTKAMMTARSLREVADVQNDYAKAAFDSFVAEGSRLSEISIKATNEAFAPLSERVSVMVEKFAKPMV